MISGCDRCAKEYDLHHPCRGEDCGACRFCGSRKEVARWSRFDLSLTLLLVLFGVLFFALVIIAEMDQ
jgi:hypothetical protein